jgi:hypothetical protein
VSSGPGLSEEGFSGRRAQLISSDSSAWLQAVAASFSGTLMENVRNSPRPPGGWVGLRPATTERPRSRSRRGEGGYGEKQTSGARCGRLWVGGCVGCGSGGAVLVLVLAAASNRAARTRRHSGHARTTDPAFGKLPNLSVCRPDPDHDHDCSSLRHNGATHARYGRALGRMPRGVRARATLVSPRRPRFRRHASAILLACSSPSV